MRTNGKALGRRWCSQKKDDGRNRQVERQVGDAEQPGETRQRIGSVLHLPFPEQMLRPLERNELLAVTVGLRGVADDESARQLVDAVQAEDERCFEAQGVARRQPASKPAGAPCGCRGASSEHGRSSFRG